MLAEYMVWHMFNTCSTDVNTSEYLFKSGLEKVFCLNQGLFKTLLNVYDGAFCENSCQSLALNYFAKTSNTDVWQNPKYAPAMSNLF